jgi:cobalt/nickel transport system permease protein
VRSEHRADPRFRLIGLLVLAFCFSSLHAPAALAGMALVTLLIVLRLGPSPAELARRLRVPGVTIAALVLLLPFVSGRTVLASIGPLDIKAEGAAAAAGIAIRFVCILSVLIALVGGMTTQRLISTLRSLGVPAMLTDMAMLMLRHVEDLRADLSRMRTAMRLRGVPAGYWHGQFRASGWALASLLLRSHARSERIYHAMILRGHGAPGAASPAIAPPRPGDWALLAALVAAGSGLVLLDRLA